VIRPTPVQLSNQRWSSCQLRRAVRELEEAESGAQRGEPAVVTHLNAPDCGCDDVARYFHADDHSRTKMML
jgi:hypothetical protein